MITNETKKIPQTIHQIWLGGKPPLEVADWMASWKGLHPEWKYCLWTEENMPLLVNQNQYSSAISMAVKADIARTEILATFGGVYVDADYECFRAIDCLIRDSELVVLSEGDGSITNSFIASIPGHPLLGDLIAEMGKVSPSDIAAEGFDPLPMTGPKLWTRVISQGLLVFESGFRLLPPDYFVVPKTRVPELLALSALRRYGTHHAMATWRNNDGLVNFLRRTRIRTRIRRFFDLSAS